MADLYEQLSRSDWRQGSCLDFTEFYESHPDCFPEFIGKPEENDLLVITPYDCSIITASLENLPVTRILVARYVAESERGLKKFYQGGKSPYQIELDHPNETDGLFCNIAEEVYIPRTFLLEHQEAYSLNEEAKTNLTRWLANYYRRPALPDSFERRFKRFKNLVERKLKKSSELAEAVERTYMRLSPKSDELGLEEKYEADIIFAIRDDLFDDRENLLTSFISGMLSDGEAINSPRESVDIEVGSEEEGSILLSVTCEPLSEITLGQIDEGYFETAWFDYLSHRHDLELEDL